MNEYRDEIYLVRGTDVLRCFDAIMEDVDFIEKSAATRVSEFNIDVTTLVSSESYNTYRFSLNELEASFDIKTDELKQIELRDTSVHKKITFKEGKATLVHAKGQDVIGQNSEWNTTTTKETIYSININGDEFTGDIDLEALYLSLTGYDLSLREETEEEIDAGLLNWWTAFMKKD